ncbi:hypothetical protein DEU56DRAFT_796768, partial [Suillus clintonianus]|uniref:uncharacterized protein n=1 Tax=Suillus clintonianus TaxID=1904413 RepID=UPI001B87458F
MGRWTQYDEDDHRLPEGMKRTGYDADSGRYYFHDREGLVYKGPEGSKFGGLTLVSEMLSSIPQEVDEDSDLEATPIRTDSYRLLALDEHGTRYNPRTWIAPLGSPIRPSKKTVISQRDNYRPKYSLSTSDLEGFTVIQGQESSG